MKFQKALLIVFGLISILNGVWMLAFPYHWYWNLPAAVPDTGPFNQHFVRDIGSAFLTVGVALVWASIQVQYAFPLVSLAALFSVLHACVHIIDMISGRMPAHHWLLDLPGIYFPAALLIYLTMKTRRHKVP